MTRREAALDLQRIRSQGQPAVGELRVLIHECELAQAAGAGGEAAWRIKATETFVEILRAAAGEAGGEIDPARRQRLDEAVLGGPGQLEALCAALASELRESVEPRAELARLRTRRRCQELRRRCLDHLDAIFNAARAQPWASPQTGKSE